MAGKACANVGKGEGTLRTRCFPSLLTHSLRRLVLKLPPKMTVIIPGIISKPSMSRSRRGLLCLCVQEPVLGGEGNLKEEALARDGACLGLSLTPHPSANSDHLAHCAMRCSQCGLDSPLQRAKAPSHTALPTV